MFRILSFLLLGTFIAFLVSYPVTYFLYKYHIVRSGEYDDTYAQIPSRKEKKGVPIMGGLIVIITVLIITVLFNASRSYTAIPLAALILCGIIGALDDILNIYGRKRPVKKLRLTIKLAMHHAKPLQRVYNFLLIPWSAYKTFFYSVSSRLGTGLHPHEKVLVQVIVGGIISYWMYFKIHWTLLWLPGGHFLHIGWLLIPLVIIMIVGTANAVNITDGMDGLSGGTLLGGYIVFMIIAYNQNNPRLSELCATTAGALIAYLYFNVKPARFEMGDVGSLALGAMLATIAILLHREIILLFAGFIFILETSSVIIQKVGKQFLHKKIFLMTPLHHHFEMIGWSEEKVVMRFWIFSIICMIVALWVSLI